VGAKNEDCVEKTIKEGKRDRVLSGFEIGEDPARNWVKKEQENVQLCLGRNTGQIHPSEIAPNRFSIGYLKK
jgi:hypothetical protein